jgi:HrpA-like RNA helicase
VPESDHLTLLHVYQQWKNNGYRGDWCARHYLQGKGLKKAKEVRLARSGMDVRGCGTMLCQPLSALSKITAARSYTACRFVRNCWTS